MGTHSLSSRKRKRNRKIPGPPQTETTPLVSPSSTTQDIVREYGWAGTKYIAQYTISVTKAVIHLLRYPVTLFIFFHVLTFITGYISQSIYQALRPLCFIPGSSALSFCHYPWEVAPTLHEISTPKWADYPALMEVQSKSLAQLLDDSVGGSWLSLEIKKAEMATSDLVALVRASDLKAKESLETLLVTFVDDSKKTGRSLQRLNSKICGAMDNLIAVNDYALQIIESAHEPVQWSPMGLWKAGDRLDVVITQTFDDVMNALSRNLARLVLEAELNIYNLNQLEEHLATLYQIITHEDSLILSAKSDLLDQLWSQLGGNQKYLKNFDRHLELLKGLEIHRQEAQVHIVSVLQTLQAMGDGMEELRERVAMPNLIGEMVPAEVHIKTIRTGLDRLREGRSRAKQLEELGSARNLLSCVNCRR